MPAPRGISVTRTGSIHPRTICSSIGHENENQQDKNRETEAKAMRAKTTPEARVVTPLMRPWLIQRAIIIDRPHQKGLGALIRLDYMGSAEFEWGSVPASLKRIRENVDAYTVFDLQVGKGKVLTVGCQEAMKEDVKYVLQTLAKGEAIPLKERAELFEWVHPEAKRYDPSTNFWWDIENDWMAWEKNDAFAAKLKQVIRNKPSV